LSSEEKCVTMRCIQEDTYIVKYKGDTWTYDNFRDANNKMMSLVRPPIGDPE